MANLIVLDVHARDVSKRMIKDKVRYQPSLQNPQSCALSTLYTLRPVHPFPVHPQTCTPSTLYIIKYTLNPETLNPQLYSRDPIHTPNHTPYARSSKPPTPHPNPSPLTPTEKVRPQLSHRNPQPHTANSNHESKTM